MLAWLLRKIGIVREHVHHIEDEFYSLADRFRAAAQKDFQKSEELGAGITHMVFQKTKTDESAVRGLANAQKIRDFFNTPTAPVAANDIEISGVMTVQNTVTKVEDADKSAA